MSYEISGNVLKGRYATYFIEKTDFDYVAIYNNSRIIHEKSLAELIKKIKKMEDVFDVKQTGF